MIEKFKVKCYYIRQLLLCGIYAQVIDFEMVYRFLYAGISVKSRTSLSLQYSKPRPHYMTYPTLQPKSNLLMLAFSIPFVPAVASP